MLKNELGKDITDLFYSLHRQEVLEKYAEKYQVGVVQGVDPKDDAPNWTDFSQVPGAEHYSTQGMLSAYSDDSWPSLRKVVRQFTWDSGYYKWCLEGEISGKEPPRELFQKLGRAGYLGISIGPGPHLKGNPLLKEAGIAWEDFNLFHEGIVHEERSRMMCPGAEDGIIAGLNIGVTPIIAFGATLKNQQGLVTDILNGDKVVCLAITEPFVGSDVAGIQTTAVLSADGTHYVVNGAKVGYLNVITPFRNGSPMVPLRTTL